MPTVDLVDETYVAVDRVVLAAAVADPVAWRRWWPDLGLEVALDRGLDGIRWHTGPAATTWIGTAEIWLEPWGDGTVLHHYQRLDPGTGGLDLRIPRAARRAARWRDRRARTWKRHAWALKDRLETRA